MRCRANKRKEKPHIDERRINAKKRGIISRTNNKQTGVILELISRRPRDNPENIIVKY